MITPSSNSEDIAARALSIACSELVRQAVREIRIIPYTDLNLELVGDKLPVFLRSRIKFVDCDKRVFHEVSSVVLPAQEESYWALANGRIDTASWPWPSTDHVHDVCVLKDALRTLVLAQRSHSDANIDIAFVLRCLARLRSYVSGSDATAVLDRIEGVLVGYQRVQDVAVLSRDRPLPAELLRDLLEDNRMVNLSESRYLLGIPGQVAQALIRVRQRVRAVVADAKYGAYLKLGTHAIRVASQATLGVSVLPGPSATVTPFVPVIYSIYDTLPACVRLQHEDPGDPTTH
jgi:hypothetical protein